MNPRPISLILAAGLLLLIGVSGMAVGSSLVGFVTDGSTTMPSVPGTKQAAVVLGFAIAAYGFATVFGGVGLVLLRRWGWRLGVVTIVAGLVGIGGATVAGGADPILLFGIAFWGTALACIFAPSTRRAIGL